VLVLAVNIVISMGLTQNDTDKTPLLKLTNLTSPLPKPLKAYIKSQAKKLLPLALLLIFFPESDGWRMDAWAMIKERSGLEFLILTKRIDRFPISLPKELENVIDLRK